MRIIPFILFTAITLVLIGLLNSSLLLPIPLGKILAPQSGVWQNAEPLDMDYNATLNFPQLKGKVSV
ncbi:MAG: hypothetical protein ACMG51_00280, partial [Ginsengibacter sp.]